MSAEPWDVPMFAEDGVVLVPGARHTDPDSSHEAAASVQGVSATQARIMDVLERYGDGTDEDIAAWYGNLAQLLDWPPVSPSGLRSRRRELVFAGLVIDTGRRGTTASGRASIIWERADRP
jgi:hypothetical protein